jgi:uncharacterized protein (UPF0333 family)
LPLAEKLKNGKWQKRNVLFKDILYIAQMIGNKGQVATEYLMITGFILVAVMLIFSYSYISNNQNIRISQANTSIDRLVNAADLVYALGPDNNQFVEIEFPVGTVKLEDITVCTNPSNGQGHNIDCGAEGAKFGALELTVELIAGNSTVSRGARSDIELDIYGDPPVIPQSPEQDERIAASGGAQKVKVYWCETKICLKRA